MTPADTLIHARWIIPVEPEAVVFPGHSLAIREGRIVDLLPTGQAKRAYQASHEIDLPHHALLPGFVNGHTHAAMTLLRGIANDLPLMDWLQQHIWPLEQQWVSAEFVRDGVDLAVAEMLRGGTTCFNDMYFFPDVTAERAALHGIRASVGLIVVDFPTVWAQHSEAYLAKGMAVYAQLQGRPLLSAAFAPHAPYTVSDQPLAKVGQLASEAGLPVHIHVHETAFEVEQAVQSTGKRPLQRLRELGLVNPSLLAVHMTQLTAEDIGLMVEAGGHIVHCPESNLKLASGFCPVAQCLAAGVNVALGTDGAASNNDLDMLGELRTAALLAKAVAQDATAVPAATALRMATLNGAKALGLDKEIGSLTIGKAADVIAIDLGGLESQPQYDPISLIVYSASRLQVTDVWVAGRQLLRARQLTGFDLDELAGRIAVWQKRLSDAQRDRR